MKAAEEAGPEAKGAKEAGDRSPGDGLGPDPREVALRIARLAVRRYLYLREEERDERPPLGPDQAGSS